VLDPSNIIDGRNPATGTRIVDEAFDLLGDSIVLAHAKDRAPEGNPCAAGSGTVDFPHYVERLRDLRFDGALVLHSLEEAEVAPSVRFLRTLLKDG
jgi:sugar phosphate isomerase/epimerase